MDALQNPLVIVGVIVVVTVGLLWWNNRKDGYSQQMTGRPPIMVEQFPARSRYQVSSSLYGDKGYEIYEVKV
jgi:hypothetical protein